MLFVKEGADFARVNLVDLVAHDYLLSVNFFSNLKAFGQKNKLGDALACPKAVFVVNQIVDFAADQVVDFACVQEAFVCVIVNAVFGRV